MKSTFKKGMKLLLFVVLIIMTINVVFGGNGNITWDLKI